MHISRKTFFYGKSAHNHQFVSTLKALLRRKEAQDGAESSFIESSVKFCIDMGLLTFIRGLEKSLASAQFYKKKFVSTSIFHKSWIPHGLKKLSISKLHVLA